MLRLEAVKNFLFKKSFDFDRPDICLYNFHPQLRLVLALKGIIFNNKKTLLRFALPTFCTLLTIVGLVFESMFVYRGLTTHDYSFASESLCYLILIGSTPTVDLSFLVYKEKIVQLFKNMNEEFKFICSLGPRYRIPFLEGQLLIWKLCFSWLTLISFTAGMFLILPVIVLVYQTLFVTHTEDTIRPLSFPMWLPKDDPYRTPNYEIFLFLQMIFCLIIVQSFGVYLYILLHILLHCYIMLDMVILDLEVIFDGLDESIAGLPRVDPRRKQMQLILNRRVKRIVTLHKYVIKTMCTVTRVYRPILIYQITFSSFFICLVAFKIAEDLDNGSFNFLFIMLGVCAGLQLWVLCYLGTVLRNKGFVVADACWNCGWHENSLAQMIRSDILIIILRAQDPLVMEFSGISKVELETFSSIMSAAYSYFNILRKDN